jgi:adenylate cyclase, class 2
MPNEVEIKFRVDDLKMLQSALRKCGFREKTRRTHEMNTLYDLPGQKLRSKGELLRLRKYGPEWVLTHKGRGKVGPHKTRMETETRLENGERMEEILRALGFAPRFRYEKFRAEWTDERGHVTIDETPIGNFGELEGPPRWIDRTAKVLGIDREQYITSSYAEVFFDWKRRTKSNADEMTFRAVGRKRR